MPWTRAVDRVKVDADPFGYTPV